MKNFTLGANVWTGNLMGAGGGNRVHASRGTIVQMKDGGGQGVTSSEFVCDGDLMHGEPGMYRGLAGIICEITADDVTANLDAAITCENCRKALKLAPVAKSAAASATLAAILQAEKTKKRIAALTTKREYHLSCVATWQIRLAELTAKYEAGDEHAARYFKAYAASYKKSVKSDTAIAEKCAAELAELTK